jgi:hypothetical protein
MSTFGRRRTTPRRDWSTLSSAPRPQSERIGVPKAESENGGAEIIQAADYPQMMKPADVGAFAASLKSAGMGEKADAIIAGQQDDLRDAVSEHVLKLELAHADGDMEALYNEAHEIRGLADTAGLRAAGRIANGLCQYLDAVHHARATPDTAAVSLHVEAIARAARATDDATALGNVVAEELAALVSRKLAEVNASAK